MRQVKLSRVRRRLRAAFFLQKLAFASKSARLEGDDE